MALEREKGGCTHHRQCDGIGTVKLPEWIRQISGAEPQFAFTSGRDFPEDLSPYAAVVHCGGCRLNAREMAARIERAQKQGVPIANYGMAIARAHNILPRPCPPAALALQELRFVQLRQHPVVQADDGAAEDEARGFAAAPDNMSQLVGC